MLKIKKKYCPLCHLIVAPQDPERVDYQGRAAHKPCVQKNEAKENRLAAVAAGKIRPIGQVGNRRQKAKAGWQLGTKILPFRSRQARNN